MRDLVSILLGGGGGDVSVYDSIWIYNVRLCFTWIYLKLHIWNILSDITTLVHCNVV